MTYIAHLELEPNAAPNHAAFADMVAEAGGEIRALPIGTTAASFEQALDVADGLVVRSDTFLQNEQYRRALADRMLEGKPVLVQVPIGQEAAFRRLLWPSLGVGPIYLRLSTTDSRPGHSRTIVVSRGENPHAFRDEVLLSGVDSVEVAQPGLLDYDERGAPLFTIPDRSLVVTDAGDNLVDWSAPELACAVRAGRTPENRNVVVMSGALLFDAYTGPFGHYFSGIEVNRQFARNLAGWLAGKVAPGRPRASVAFDLADTIERLLMSWVHQSLQQALGDTWWVGGVPLDVRKKCAVLGEEKGDGLPLENNLYLIDLESIMTRNWSLFEPLLSQAGWTGGKVQAMSWLRRCNDIRNIVMHAARRHFSGRDVTDDQLAHLKDVLSRLQLITAKRAT